MLLFFRLLFQKCGLALVILIAFSSNSFANFQCHQLFRDSLAIDQEFWSNHTLGIDAEFVIPLKLSYDNVAELLIRKIKRQYPEIKVRSHRELDEEREREIIVISYILNGFEKRWKIGSDESIKAPTGFYGIEIATPILRTPSDLVSWFSLLKDMEDSGAKIEPNSTGVHFHSRMKKISGGKIIFLTALWSKIEAEIHRSLKISSYRMPFTPPYPKLLKNKLYLLMESVLSDINAHRNPDEIIKIFKDFSDPNFLRQHTIRYGLDVASSMRRHGTFEFRIFTSTLNQKGMYSYIDFISRLLIAIDRQDSRLVELYIKYYDQNIPLVDIENIIGSHLTKSSQDQETFALKNSSTKTKIWLMKFLSF